MGMLQKTSSSGARSGEGSASESAAACEEPSSVRWVTLHIVGGCGWTDPPLERTRRSCYRTLFCVVEQLHRRHRGSRRGRAGARDGGGASF